MKIFSFKKPIDFKGENIVINDLARNHKYRKENQYFVVEGKSEDCKIEYTAFYNLEGEFQFVKLHKHQHLSALVCWKQEYDIQTIEKINKDGNSIIVTSKYLSTSMFEHKLVEKSFYTCVENEIHQKVFRLTNEKWTSEGKFPQKYFLYWISK